jgi:hypothetical protein
MTIDGSVLDRLAAGIRDYRTTDANISSWLLPNDREPGDVTKVLFILLAGPAKQYSVLHGTR